MDPKISWFQPEQEGPAKDYWGRLWDTYINLQKKEAKQDTKTKISEEGSDISVTMKRTHAQANLTPWTTNLASTYGMDRNKDSLIGTYGGCPWRPHGKRYDSRALIA